MSTTSSSSPNRGNHRLPAPHLPTHLLDVIQTVWQWRRAILLTTAAGFIGSILVSLAMPEYFKAETSFLAISPDQAAPESIFGTPGTKPFLYGNMNDIDRMLAIGESNELVEFLIDSFDLYTHYDIDPSKTQSSVTVSKEFFGLYEISKTPRDIITIEVEDQDPTFAATLANAARDRIDFLSRKIIRDAQGKSVSTLSGEVAGKQQLLNAYGDSIRMLQERYQLYDIATQQEVLSSEQSNLEKKLAETNAKLRAYQNKTGRGVQDSIFKLEMTLAGILDSRTVLDSQLIRLNEGMGPIMNFMDNRGSLIRSLNDDSERLKQYEAAMRTTPPSIALLEAARVPVVKARPKRMFIVLGITVLAFIFGVFGALLIENARRYRWEDLLHK